MRPSEWYPGQICGQMVKVPKIEFDPSPLPHCMVLIRWRKSLITLFYRLCDIKTIWGQSNFNDIRMLFNLLMSRKDTMRRSRGMPKLPWEGVSNDRADLKSLLYERRSIHQSGVSSFIFKKRLGSSLSWAKSWRQIKFQEIWLVKPRIDV